MKDTKRASTAFSVAVGRHAALTLVSKMAAAAENQRPRILRDALVELVGVPHLAGGGYPIEPALDSFARIMCVAFMQTGPMTAFPRRARSVKLVRMLLAVRALADKARAVQTPSFRPAPRPAPAARTRQR
jgi:hypothetical protein